MPKALLRRYLPDPDKIMASPSLGFLGHRLRDPSIWHLNRRSASGAVFWGLFCAFLPMPLQMVPAAIGVLLLRVNLPVTILLVWLTNPLTWLPCMYAAYTVGTLLTGAPTLGMDQLREVLDELAGMMGHWGDGAEPARNAALGLYLRTFVIGSLSLGTGLGSLGYIATRLYWRWHVVKAWRARAARRSKAALSD